MQNLRQPHDVLKLKCVAPPHYIFLSISDRVYSHVEVAYNK